MKSRTSRNSRKAFFTGNRRPLFYYVTDRRQLAGTSLDGCIRRALEWGVDFIQIREKDLPDSGLYEQVRRAVALAHKTACVIVVNGRADIAMAAGARGVHLPSTGLRAPDIRPWLPDDFLIGVSAHTVEEIRQVGAEGADYAFLGHLFPTPSKSGLGDPVGLQCLEKVCAEAPIPVFGLGGIHAGRIAAVVDAGAVGVAGISLFQGKGAFEALEKRYPHGGRPPA